MQASIFHSAYSGKRVLVTGHTGFKGAWLVEWLLELGAEVTGLALPPEAQGSLFDQLGLSARICHKECDIRDFSRVCAIIREGHFDMIFHLAAQSLVHVSYAQPLETYAVNVMGTVNLLEAVRQAGYPCGVLVLTSDKCYENREWIHSYREEDPLGGFDPYSSSKGAAELIVSAYRNSYFSSSRFVRLASARAGNVVGGGDWAESRIMPDCIRALQRGEPILVRNKASTRPWQHVLEPLSGYLVLGSKLLLDEESSPEESAFNFGPPLSSNRTVLDLVQEVLKHWPGTWQEEESPGGVHEAKLLNLASDKAFHLLRWQPVWNFSKTIEKTVTWYKMVFEHKALPSNLLVGQIEDYVSDAKERGIDWAR